MHNNISRGIFFATFCQAEDTRVTFSLIYLYDSMDPQFMVIFVASKTQHKDKTIAKKKKKKKKNGTFKFLSHHFRFCFVLSKTHKRLKERLFNWTNRTKRAHFGGSPLFQASCPFPSASLHHLTDTR